MKVFVTGSTGFVGRNLVEFLLKQEQVELTCLVRNLEKASSMQDKGIQIIHGDLLDPSTYEKALGEAEWVFHVAALVGLKNGPEFYTANRDGTACLLHALKSSQTLKRLVFLSSIAAVDRSWDHDWTRFFDSPLDEESPICPTTDYGKSKRQAEELIIESGFPYSILRPAYIYGPHPRSNSSMDKIVYHVRDRIPYTRFPFPGVASEIFVEDLAEALWHVAHHEKALNQDFFVANPKPQSISNFFQKLAQCLEAPYSPQKVSEKVMARFMRYQFAMRPTDPLVRILYTNYFHCSAEKLKQYTGYVPQIGFNKGLAETIEWYQQEGKL